MEDRILRYEGTNFGNLIIDLETLTVQNSVDWVRMWKSSSFDPDEYADHIGKVFDYFYEQYEIEHNYEPEIYAETLGNFQVVLKTKTSEYHLHINLNEPSHIVEQTSIYNL